MRGKRVFRHTGSSRENGKSKTVCSGIHFHKSWVFSAVLGPELATNLSSTAPRSTTITRRHPKKLAYLKCFLAPVDCLRQTAASPHLSKCPYCVLRLVRTKISRMNTYRFFFTANFTPHTKNSFWVFAQSLRVSCWPQAATQSLGLKLLRKPNFFEKECLCKPFYFCHSFWMTL